MALLLLTKRCWAQTARTTSLKSDHSPGGNSRQRRRCTTMSAGPVAAKKPARQHAPRRGLPPSPEWPRGGAHHQHNTRPATRLPSCRDDQQDPKEVTCFGCTSRRLQGRPTKAQARKSGRLGCGWRHRQHLTRRGGHLRPPADAFPFPGGRKKILRPTACVQCDEKLRTEICS